MDPIIYTKQNEDDDIGKIFIETLEEKKQKKHIKIL